ncbi:MAG: DJ-1/PfpI family protein [Vulcanimicrobiaceae bacterium]
MRIGMIAFPHMQLLDFAGPLEVFSLLPDAQVDVLSLSLDPVQTTARMSVAPTRTFETRERFDVLFVPGGSGVANVVRDDRYAAFLLASSERASYLTAVCTGSLVLGAAGLLRGYRATTHWRYMELLAACGATPSDERVVIDRNRITGGGVTAGLDFALRVVSILNGDSVAKYVQLAIEYDPDPPFAGNPRDADPEVIQRYRDDTAARFEERRTDLAAALVRLERGGS